MIFAWGILIVSLFLFILGISVIFMGEKPGKNFFKILVISTISILASLQYIFGN